MTRDDELTRALLQLTGFFNRPQADAALLQRAGSSLDRALFPLLIRASVSTSITVSELADTVGRHYSTVSRQVSALEKLGLVRRTGDPDDGRRALVHVTSRGRTEALRIADARRDAMGLVFSGWSSSDKTELTRLVNRLADSLEATLADLPRAVVAS